MFVNKVKAIPKINNFREICRICLHECSSSFQLIQQEISIVKFLQKITNVDYSKKSDVPLPQRICSKCVQRANGIRQFIAKCIKADGILKQYVLFNDIDDESPTNLEDSVPNNVESETIPIQQIALVENTMRFQDLSNDDIKNETPNAKVTPNIKGLARRKAAAGKKTPANKNIADKKETPNIKETPSVKEISNVKVSPNLKVTPNKKETSNAKVTPNKKQTSNAKVTPNKKVTPNAKITSINKEMSEVKVTPNLKLDMNDSSDDTIETPGTNETPNKKQMLNPKQPPNKKPRLSVKQTSTLQQSKSEATKKNFENSSSGSDSDDAVKKLYECVFCNKKFANVDNLVQHKLTHKGQSYYQCEICLKNFRVLKTLTRHKLTHEKQEECDVCSKSFNANDITEHKLGHIEELKYKCEVCPEAFDKSSALKLHSLKHEEEDPFSCKICLEGFTSWSSLYEHHILKHN